MCTSRRSFDIRDVRKDVAGQHVIYSLVTIKLMMFLPLDQFSLKPKNFFSNGSLVFRSSDFCQKRQVCDLSSI